MTSVTSKGQVTIPKDIRDRIGIEPGDELVFEVENGELKIRKDTKNNPFSRWKGEVETDKSTEEVMEELRGEDNS